MYAVDPDTVFMWLWTKKEACETAGFSMASDMPGLICETTEPCIAVWVM